VQSKSLCTLFQHISDYFLRDDDIRRIIDRCIEAYILIFKHLTDKSKQSIIATITNEIPDQCLRDILLETNPKTNSKWQSFSQEIQQILKDQAPSQPFVIIQNISNSLIPIIHSIKHRLSNNEDYPLIKNPRPKPGFKIDPAISIPSLLNWKTLPSSLDKYRLGYNALQTFISNRIKGPSCYSTIIPIENQLYDLQHQYDNSANDILKQSFSSGIATLTSQHKGNIALASHLIINFYERNLSPLLVNGDGSCLFHATNAAHQAINNNTDIIPSPDLRLAACTLARDFLLSDTSICTEQNLLELEHSLDESEDVFNELIFLSLATIRNGEIIILNEMGIITSYVPHAMMNQILLQGREHPFPPQAAQS
jgi:hypothetical protein